MIGFFAYFCIVVSSFIYSHTNFSLMKAKYDLSLIMKRAWVILRKSNGQKSWSDCLKESWSIAKNGITANDFNAIYNKYYNMVFYHVIQKVSVREIAEEITSDTFVAAHTHLANYDVHMAKLNTWLITIAGRKVIDYYRSKANNKQSQTTYVDGYTDEDGNSSYEFDGHVSNPQEVMEGNELSEKIECALSELDDKYKVPAILNIVDGYKYEKIATMLDIPLNTVKTRIARAKVQLQEKLKGVI